MPRPDAPSSPGSDAPSFFGNDTLNDLLWQVTAHALLMADAALAGTPLTHASSSMLIGVSREPGMTVADISRRIAKTPQTISSVVARLEKLGLIERRLGTGRGVGLYVTDAGQKMAQLAATREEKLNAQLCSLLGKERSTALTELLRESRAILREAR